MSPAHFPAPRLAGPPGSIRFANTTTALAAALLTTLALPGVAAVTFETRALSGQQVPGAEPGVKYLLFAPPVLNLNGQTAFRSSLTELDNVTSVLRGAIFSDATRINGDLVVRSGDATPGSALGVTISGFTDPLIDDHGRTAFVGFLEGPGFNASNNQAIFSEAAGSLGQPGLVARVGDAAPDTSAGVTYSYFAETPAFNRAGQIAFSAVLKGSGVDTSNNRAIYSEAAGSIGSPALIARSGDAAPGIPPGATYRTFQPPVLNAAGQTAFLADLTGPGTEFSRDRAIYSEAAGLIGSPGLVVREGDAVSSETPGLIFSSLFDFGFNDQGQTAFRAGLAGPGVDVTNNEAIFSEAAGSIGRPRLVARNGDPAPGTEPGVVFTYLGRPLINRAGQTTFWARLTGPGVDETNDAGIFSEAAGSIGNPYLVVRNGDPAPGTGPGIRFRGAGNTTINRIGQIAFFGSLIGEGIDSTNDRGLWATDLNGQVTLVVREGDVIDVSSNPASPDLRSVASIRNFLTVNNEDGQGSAFNDLGQIALSLSFTDGSSGIVVANVPEPAAAALLAALVMLTSRRRRA